MSIEINLRGKRALVAGSTQGIGLATAQAMAAAGASCWLLARNEEALQRTKDSLSIVSPEQKHGYLIADFSKAVEVSAAIEQIKAIAPFHILVNNAGGPAPGPITEATEEAFLAAYQQHLLVNHRLVQALLPGMRAQQYGRIINIISTSVRIPLPNLGVSNTTRAAVAAWAKTLSNELAKDSITVNNILPGLTETARLASLIRTEAAAKGISEQTMADQMRASVPARRFADASEPAQLACFLASPLAAYITGVSIPVDGGRTGSI
ncbi:MAG: SDR family oxidoreductase [Chitinophagaceae bacterium]